MSAAWHGSAIASHVVADSDAQRLIDCHCHLAGEEFAADLDAVVARARDAGVDRRALHPRRRKTTPKWRARAVVRAAWPTVRFATGIHPHHAGQFAGDHRRRAEAVRGGASRPSGACAIGEIGLDYHYDFSPRDVQQEVFRAQIRLALERDLPIIIHTREATDDTFRILREEGAGGPRRVSLLHRGCDDGAARRSSWASTCRSPAS